MNGDKKFKEIYEKFGGRYGDLIYYQKARQAEIFEGKLNYLRAIY